MEIRPEIEADHLAITDVTERAFRGRPYAGGNEQDIIVRLRDLNALSLSLVAIKNGVVVGQITFSPAGFDGESEQWFALGPVSVLPQEQGSGIGSALIRAGLEHLREVGANGCILTGSPSYYDRFGFIVSPENCPEDQPKAYFQVVAFGSTAHSGNPSVPATPKGRFTFHHAFYDN